MKVAKATFCHVLSYAFNRKHHWNKYICYKSSSTEINFKQYKIYDELSNSKDLFISTYKSLRNPGREL